MTEEAMVKKVVPCLVENNPVYSCPEPLVNEEEKKKVMDKWLNAEISKEEFEKEYEDLRAEQCKVCEGTLMTYLFVDDVKEVKDGS